MRDRLRLSLNDWLLTLSTVLLILVVFDLTPMQATGFFALHAGAITILLAVMAISTGKTAILMMALSLLVSLPRALLQFVALQSACPGRGPADDRGDTRRRGHESGVRSGPRQLPPDRRRRAGLSADSVGFAAYSRSWAYLSTEHSRGSSSGMTARSRARFSASASRR